MKELLFEFRKKNFVLEKFIEIKKYVEYKIDKITEELDIIRNATESRAFGAQQTDNERILIIIIYITIFIKKLVVYVFYNLK